MCSSPSLSQRQMSSPSPLRRKLIWSGCLVIGILSAALLLCMSVLLYNTSYTANMLNTNHLHSSALQQLDILRDAAEAFRVYPDAETRGKLDLAFDEMDSLLLQFEDSQLPEKQRALVHSILQTYSSYQTEIGKLYLFSDEDLGSQAFFVQFYAAQEASTYIDTYLKQLIQQSLSDEHDSYAAQMKMIKFTPLLAGCLIILSAALLYWFSIWLYRHIVTPLFRLSNAAEMLAGNEMSLPDLPVTSCDEVGTLTKNFNKMKNDCRNLLTTRAERDALNQRLLNEHIQRITAEQQLSSAQFAALRNQVNPHFLFNTLALIVQIASKEDAYETRQLIQQLSDLLRYNLYNTAPSVPLAQEIEVLHHYIHIQETRFRDRISCWVDCRIDTGSVEIPAFTLQPLVENSIRHGIEAESGYGQIRIRIEEKSGFVHITITDNGAGMDRETLDSLRFGTYIPKREDSGIGVGNVAARLKMLYPDSSFQIYSLKGIGTSIRLVYPAVFPGWREKRCIP